MPILIVLMMLLAGKQAIYYGSTPADETVRRFLNISLTDSIDFIRWQIILQDDQYTLKCAYGLCEPNTSGFSNEKRVNMQGKVVRQGTYFALQYSGRLLRVVEINSNLLHIMNDKSMLIGNGGWSYTLNREGGIVTSQCATTAGPISGSTAFQGRTPCPYLSTSPTCLKKKWYLILFIDPATKQPSHYLIGGRQYKQETMRRGHWAIERRADGRYVYKLDPGNGEPAIRLLQADENILLFTDAKSNLLVGNEHFSYTLSKTYIR